MKIFLLIGLISTIAIAQTPKYSSNRLIVKLNPYKSIPKIASTQKWRELFPNHYVVYTNDLEKTQAELKNNSSVAYVEKDFYSGKVILPQSKSLPNFENTSLRKNNYFNDPMMGRLWAFAAESESGMAVTEAYLRFQAKNKKEIIVAVVDTGVDYNHEDLKTNIWTNSQEIPGNHIDDDKNGYVDDLHGINTLERDKEGNATGDMMDGQGHGTHVSGTIGAVQNNELGIAGVASTVKIMGIRTVPNDGDELDVDVIESYIYAAKNGAKIINCSFGKAHNEGGLTVAEAINYIGKEYGVLVVVAAGNDTANIDNRPTYPASYTSENMLVVAASSPSGGLSYFSNYGKVSVDVAAPGSLIYSTVPNDDYESNSGTSMATPNTVGVAAEILSRAPHLGPTEIKQLIMQSVTKVPEFENKLASAGRVNLRKALQLLQQ
jgi:subtilisin family serine protease